jgi:Zn-dependent M16 (insulinase) family peptidase
MTRSTAISLLLIAVLSVVPTFARAAGQPASANAFTSLHEAQHVDGFRVTALYLNDADEPIGARFVHVKSGFTLDLLQIESLPQGYTWVNSFPVSDQGEPHTQEHLLLGKGTTGRAFAGLDTMWLSASNAFTQQWRTSYHFNTSAGPSVFFDLLAAQLNALLNPNYTDEEIRREVRNFGVTQNPDGTLRLEEKGSVYNEMVSSSGSAFSQLFRRTFQLVYGMKHPLSYNSGGEPSGIRTMQPSDIRGFHDANYYLGNIGTIVAMPSRVTLHETLSRVDSILNKLQKDQPARPARRMNELPTPDMAAAGTIVLAEYPQKNAQQPSPVMLAWPATRELDANERLLLELFMSNFAGDATTTLYKRFIDSSTRTMDIGAKSVGNGVGEAQGQPVYIYFGDVAATNLSKEKLGDVRTAVMADLRRVASFADDSPELKEFNERIAARVAETHRDLSKFVNSPPGFGFRNTGSDWMDQLLELERTSGFRKSVTMKPQLAFVSSVAASKKNLWRDYLSKWQLTTVDPYVVAVVPSPQLLARDEAERLQRSSTEAARLQQKYAAADTQEAIRRYRTDYDAESARIEATARDIVPARFVDAPPMTLDDSLQYRTVKLAHDVPLVASTFDNMSSARVGVALRLDGVPEAELRYLELLPALMSRVGVIENDKPVSYEEMTDRLRKEILSLDASFSTNPRTGRAELVVRGSGNDAAETRRAIEWMRLVLEHPNWRVENLPRIRDVVDQSLSQLRNTMQGSEESWVQNPPESYRRQDNALLLATGSFLTREHAALRLRWLLKEAAPADRDALTSWLTSLATIGGTPRAELKAFLASTTSTTTSAAANIAASLQPIATGYASLSPSAKSIATDALRDLDQTLGGIPDASLASDWTQLVNGMRDDLLVAPADVLARLDVVRRRILHAANARMFEVGATATQKSIEPAVAALAASLNAEAVERATYRSARRIDERLQQRGAASGAPTFVALLAPNMKGGVILNTVPGATYDRYADRDAQLDYLASRLYAGGGAHGIFLKTIGAGLAYSNGLRGAITSGRLGYYAERTPELPQTVRFVINELKSPERDPHLADYVVAQAFAEGRAGQTYEQRAEAMAVDVAEGNKPEDVRRFRESILALRKEPGFIDQLYARKDAVYSRALPGYTSNWKPATGGIYFVIGPDRQLDAYEQYLKSAVAPETTLVRMYPRDFWID